MKNIGRRWLKLRWDLKILSIIALPFMLFAMALIGLIEGLDAIMDVMFE